MEDSTWKEADQLFAEYKFRESYELLVASRKQKTVRPERPG